MWVAYFQKLQVGIWTKAGRIVKTVKAQNDTSSKVLAGLVPV